MIGDLGDIANEIMQSSTENIIKGIRAAAQSREVEPTGYCLYCTEDIPDPQLFCDCECSKAWETRKNFRRV